MRRVSRSAAERFWRSLAGSAHILIVVGCLVGRADVPAFGKVLPTAVILCEGLHADALADPELPALREMANEGAVGLMAMPPAIARSPYSAMLSLATGSPAQGTDTDADAYLPTDAVERGSPFAALRRRTGHATKPEPGAHVFVHIGIGSLTRRGYAERLIGARVSTNSRISVDVTEWREGTPRSNRLGSLLAVGLDGIGNVRTNASSGVTIMQVGHDRAEINDALRKWMGLRCRIWLLTYVPSPDQVRSYLARPTLTLVWEPNGKQAALTSPTTRTPGLISYADVAPSLLEWTGSVPDPSLPGHAVVAVRAADPVMLVRSYDRVVAANAAGMVTVLTFYGALAGLVLAIGMWGIRRRPAVVPVVAVGCRMLMPLPLAFLLSGPIMRVATQPLAPVQYAIAIGIACFVVWAIVEGLIRSLRGKLPIHYVGVTMVLTVLSVVADAVTGQHLHKSSVLAAAGGAGTRFYGIGNEYMGFTVAASLGIACMFGVCRTGAAVLGLAVISSLGLGSVGANAGGVVTASTGFLLCLWPRRSGRPSLGVAVACFVAGIAVAVAFAMVDRAIAGSGASHLGAAVGAATRSGAEAALAIARRKADLALTSVLSAPGLFSVFGFIALCVAAWAGCRRDLDGVAVAYPGWQQWHSVSVPTAVAAFLANDTGIVPMLIIYGACLMVGLMIRFCMVAPAPLQRSVSLPPT